MGLPGYFWSTATAHLPLVHVLLRGRRPPLGVCRLRSRRLHTLASLCPRCGQPLGEAGLPLPQLRRQPVRLPVCCLPAPDVGPLCQVQGGRPIRSKAGTPSGPGLPAAGVLAHCSDSGKCTAVPAELHVDSRAMQKVITASSYGTNICIADPRLSACHPIDARRMTQGVHLALSAADASRMAAACPVRSVSSSDSSAASAAAASAAATTLCTVGGQLDRSCTKIVR
jgi:hypothetical protein